MNKLSLNFRLNEFRTLLTINTLITITKYSNDGKKISEHRLFEIDNLNNYSTYQYNDQGKLHESKIYKYNNKLIRLCKFLYDERGNLVKENYRHGSNITETVEYRLDKKNNILYKTMNKSDATPFYNKEDIKLDSKGNWIESRTFSTIHPSSERMYTAEYNTMNMLTKQKTYLKNNNDDTQTHEFKYDKYSNTISEKVSSSYGNNFEITYDYRYDNKGNWIKKKKIEDGLLVSITSREIIYN